MYKIMKVIKNVLKHHIIYTYKIISIYNCIQFQILNHIKVNKIEVYYNNYNVVISKTGVYFLVIRSFNTYHTYFIKCRLR